ncbi:MULTISPECIES: TetR/AcrR family transcriptional regulator [Cryobacterium]|nr:MULTISPECIES: TetR/AcrR family transcriptional regulator [Cryobacterium]
MRRQRPSDATTVAIALLSTRGYEATTVEELADAAQISRSTFFRRFGSKEDVVFADHDYLLERLSAYLDAASGDPLEALRHGARIVLDHHLSRREASLTRHELLQRNPTLRDRELVSSHRYERAFASYLREVVPGASERGWAITALAAGIVSVHNDMLRAWLKRAEIPATEILDTQLRSLCGLFSPVLFPDPNERAASSRVVVAVFDRDIGPGRVLARIQSAIDGAVAF